MPLVAPVTSAVEIFEPTFGIESSISSTIGSKNGIAIPKKQMRGARMPEPVEKLTPKGKQSRARIIAVASQLVLERGMRGTTMEEIQHAAGVSASQLYHYFANKRDLLAAVIHSQTEVTLANELLVGMRSLQALHQWRDAVVDAAKHLGGRAGCPLASLGEELRETDPQLLDLVAKGLTYLTELVADGIAAMRDSGELRADVDIHQLALVAVTAYEGGLLVAQIQRDVAPLEAALDAAIAHIEAAAIR